MEQLSSIDASFIQAESPNLPMHITSISIYDPSTAPQGTVRFKSIVQLFHDAIYDVPLLRRRLVEVPGNMDFPYWIEDPDFDIEFHVRHIALPKPGDWRQLYIQLARLHSRPLDMHRPLWEVYVIEGLNHLEGVPPGSFAVVQKLHHAAVDGDSVKRMFTAMHELEPAAPKTKTARKTLIREERPRKLPLLFKSYQRYLRRPAKLSRAVVKTIQGVRQVNAAIEEGELGEAPTAPNSPFNGEVSPHRVVTSVDFDFDEFKRLRQAVPGATVNDVAVCVIGGALRRYLESKGEPVDEALVAQIPVNIRSDEKSEETGNEIAPINASSGSNIADPRERLEAVTESTRTAKKRLEVMGASMAADLSDAMGPHMTRAIFAAMENAPKIKALANLMPAGPNFAISNMPGPPIPMYLCGAELKWGIGLGPLMPNMGLFVTVTSGLGRFVYGVNACREMMPDPEFFAECLVASFEESCEVLGRGVKPGSPKPKAAKAR